MAPKKRANPPIVGFRRRLSEATLSLYVSHRSRVLWYPTASAPWSTTNDLFPHRRSVCQTRRQQHRSPSHGLLIPHPEFVDLAPFGPLMMIVAQCDPTCRASPVAPLSDTRGKKARPRFSRIYSWFSGFASNNMLRREGFTSNWFSGFQFTLSLRSSCGDASGKTSCD